MSFSRFGLLRGRQRLVGGLARSVLNGMPLVHQRLSGGGSSKYFDGVGSNVAGGIIGGIVGASATGYVSFRYYKRKQDFDESRNFEKFLKGHHVPPQTVPYYIQRTTVDDQIKNDILKRARIPQVVNIIAAKNLGKSVAIKKGVKSIIKNNYPGYKVFYIDAAQTFQKFLSNSYGLNYADEWEAVEDWMNSLGQYAVQHPTPRILVVLDSPGSWEEELTEKQLRKIMRFMKGSVASMGMTFYCVSSPDKPPTKENSGEIKNIFTKERVGVLGTRFREIKQFGEYQEWGIDFTLDTEEKDQLIKNFELVNGFKFTTQEKEDLRLSETNTVGDFLNEVGET